MACGSAMLITSTPVTGRIATLFSKKLLEEEEKNYHIALPRSFHYFISGLHMAFYSYLLQKGKGRVIADFERP
jgi:hypothetical protein